MGKNSDFQNLLAFSNSAHKKYLKQPYLKKIAKNWVKIWNFQNPIAFSNSAHKKYLKQPYLKKIEKKNFFSKNF